MVPPRFPSFSYTRSIRACPNQHRPDPGRLTVEDELLLAVEDPLPVAG